MTDVPLKHLCSLPPEYGLNITPDRYRDEGVRLLRTSDIATGGGVRDSGGVFLDAVDVPAEMLLRDGDLLFSRSGTLGRALLYSRDQHGEATFAGFLVRFRLRRGIDPRAIRYWSESAPFVGTVASEAIQSTISNFNADRYANLAVPGWLVEHSVAVADYLDAETARIDALHQRRISMMALLGEWEQANLLRLLGDWRTARTAMLRQLGTTVVTGPFGTQLAASEYSDGGVPVINPTHISDGRLAPDPRVAVPPDVARRLARHTLGVGDIVMGRKGDVGRAAVVGPAEAGWICGSDSIAIRTDPQRLLPEFLALALSVAYYRQQLEAQSTGATLANVNESILMGFRVPTMTVARQREAVDSGTERQAARPRMAGLLRDQADLLLERRQALITAAVTGQLEISGVAA